MAARAKRTQTWRARSILRSHESQHILTTLAGSINASRMRSQRSVPGCKRMRA